ncbi:TapB family protein [Microscilla marina]|uniref:DUF3108 domain-containing protein n=1 Tax=Microscilla marina ATCC 23134 TaxID=313606 RepID=A1ZUC3_MICM2|nr:hypothetical protein [Microscilla marina]EAY25942.1 conserved hypothetical protein [Microscilla marina ATCC 23134]
MKRFKNLSLFVLNLLILSALMAFVPGDSGDCTMYIASSKGATMELKNYSRKGKLQNIVRLNISDKTEANGKVMLNVDYAYYDKKDKDVKAKGKYKAVCENGVFKFEFGALTPVAGQQKGKNMKIEMESDYLDIPANPSVGQTLKNGTLTMKVQAEGMPNMFNTKIAMTDRKVVGLEKVTTPAGTFDCVKITYNSEMKMSFIKTRSRTVEWFAKGVGLVRSEFYNKRGKMAGYTILTKLKK